MKDVSILDWREVTDEKASIALGTAQKGDPIVQFWESKGPSGDLLARIQGPTKHNIHCRLCLYLPLLISTVAPLPDAMKKYHVICVDCAGLDEAQGIADHWYSTVAASLGLTK